MKLFKELSPEEYLAMSLPDRADWLKKEVAEAIAEGRDIKIPILIVLTVESRAEFHAPK